MRGGGGDGREEATVFYSRRLLAKDGPLATVWLAAHFDRKLRKHHIAKASIPSSVDAILQSEVPIALRLLGYLLIGVVRIYAKKVAYVYHGCNEALLGIRNSCVSGKGKHYGESSSVSALSFEIPERFELDSFNLEVLEDRTFASVMEQARQEDAHAIGANQSLSTSMILSEEGCSHNRHGFSLSWDVFSPEDAGIDLEATYLHRLSNAEASLERLLDYGSPQKAISDTEVPCHSIIPLEDFQIHNELENEETKLCLNENLDADPVHSFTASEEHHHLSNYETGGSKLIEHQILYEIPDKICDIGADKFDKSIMGLDVCLGQTSDKASTSIPESTFSLSPAGSFTIPKSVITPEFLLIPTPRKDESRAPKKRKHSFDGSIVLSNEVIRKGLHNANDLVRKRKKISGAVLDVWNAHKNLVLEHNFLEPINPYMSPEFKAVFQKVYLHHKDKERVEVEADQTTTIFTDEPSESHGLLSNEALNDQLDPSPEQNLVTINGIVFETSPQCPREAEPQICESSTKAYSLLCNSCSYPEDLSKSPRTPTKNKEARSIQSSVTPELESQIGRSEMVIDLSDKVLFSFEDSRNQDWWSNRTRVVARCLENSFERQIQQKDVTSLSLAKLANKRSRRTCARLFYEILVLKSTGHIDVKQHSPYDDIFLLATPAMKFIS